MKAFNTHEYNMNVARRLGIAQAGVEIALDVLKRDNPDTDYLVNFLETKVKEINKLYEEAMIMLEE